MFLEIWLCVNIFLLTSFYNKPGWCSCCVFFFFHPVAKVRRKRSIFYVLGSHLTLSLSPPFLGFHNPPIKLTKCLPFFSCLFFALSIESIGESLFRLLLLLPLLHFPRNEGKGERGEKIALTSILLLRRRWIMEPPPTKEKKIAEKSTLATKKDFCRKVPYRYSIPRVGGMRAFFFLFSITSNFVWENPPLIPLFFFRRPAHRSGHTTEGGLGLPLRRGGEVSRKLFPSSGKTRSLGRRRRRLRIGRRTPKIGKRGKN